MMALRRPSDSSIRSQIDLAIQYEGKFWNHNYEEGVQCALEWVLGNTTSPPMGYEDEYEEDEEEGENEDAG